MKKISLLLLALIAGATLQLNAQPSKAPMRSAIFTELPSGFEQVGSTSIYYDMSERYAAAAGYQTGVSIIGEIDGKYYSSTYESGGEGAGFVAAIKVGNNDAVYVNSSEGTENNGVSVATRVEPQGDVAARIVYTLTNNNNSAVTVSAGVWGDIMIGNNDRAPLSKLTTAAGNTYAIDMKYQDTEDSPLLCILFGEGITGVTAADDFWFGYFCNNYAAADMVGNYDNILDWSFYSGDEDSNYMEENGDYDCGLGFCWKNREIGAGEAIELSYLISVGEVPFDDPVVPEVGDSTFTCQVAAYDFDEWNDLSVAHPAHVWGYYEHPYGQEGYIEYMVDDAEWIRISTPLASGADYDLDFDMYFDENITDVHNLKVRFTLGLDDYAYIDTLEWVDVRSITAENIPTLVYNGEPQVFTITVGGTEYTIGTDEEYIYPGTYTAVTILGDFDENTIGINNIDFTIDKAPGVVNVTVPEDTKYDGEAHAATATVPEGSGNVTIYYTNIMTGEKTTEAPTAVGDYSVSVVVTEGEYYYGIEETICGEFEIYEDPTAIEEISTDSKDNGAWYTVDGARVAAPSQPGFYIHNGKKYIVK